MSSAFNDSLNSFVTDVAYKGSIRHLTDLQYSPTKIQKTISYPVSMEIIGKVMLEYLLEQKVVVNELPEPDVCLSRDEFVESFDSFGRKSFIKVSRPIEQSPDMEYVPFNVGSIKYNDRTRYKSILSMLEVSDADYVDNIPWPIGKLYHLRDDRIDRITSVIESCVECE